MTLFFVDIIWLFGSIGIGWIIFERTKPKEKRTYKLITTIGFISWLVFKTLHRAVITTKGTPLDALLVGALFGTATLLVCFAIKWFFARKKKL